MKKNALLFLFVFPLLVLACLAFYRKKHSVIGGQYGLMPSGVASVNGNLLHKSHNIWTNRAFITVKENDEAFRAVETLASSLPISENLKSNAVQSCVGIIKAYGRGDWRAFLSARAPFSDYDINPQAVGALEREVKHCNVTNVSKVTTATALDIYHLVWEDLVDTNGLFSDISFIANSITMVETSPNYLVQIAVPSFTAKTNENYFTLSPRSILDYSTKLSMQQSQKIEALRFFFFGKKGRECDFYMFIFALNEQSGVWIPWRLTIGYTAAPSHKVAVF